MSNDEKRELSKREEIVMKINKMLANGYDRDAIWKFLSTRYCCLCEMRDGVLFISRHNECGRGGTEVIAQI